MEIWHGTRVWLALVGAPTLALAAQSIMYALVTPSCSTQTRVLIHAVAFASLALAAVLTLLARAEWSRLAPAASGAPDSDVADPLNVRRFLAVVATAVAGLSCLVIVAMWFAAWVLSPCSS